MKIRPVSRLKINPIIPGDKSISHRALIICAMAKGISEISNLSRGLDVLSTWRGLKALGVKFKEKGDIVAIDGQGLYGFSEPMEDIDCGNSGTTMRLLMGLLAAQGFNSRLTGDESLVRRPMIAAARPLRKMGGSITLNDDSFAPVKIEGRKLSGIEYEIPIPSAQIKSAILLAGLCADGETLLRGHIGSRDHTERLLAHVGADISSLDEKIFLRGRKELHPRKINIPGDISSASCWMAAACITPQGFAEFKNIGLNPTRMGFVDVIRKMGAHVEVEARAEMPEPYGIIRVRQNQLRGVEIGREEIPYLIDEIPLIAVLGIFAEGRTKVTGARELRFKESDRIESIVRILRNAGVKVEEFEDGFEIPGPQQNDGSRIDPLGDHRIAMAFSISSLRASGETEIMNAECVDVSYPGFFRTLEEVINA